MLCIDTLARDWFGFTFVSQRHTLHYRKDNISQVAGSTMETLETTELKLPINLD